MAGTVVGGIKARNTNRQKHGKDFYQKIGSIGGKLSTTGGFASEKIGKDGLTGRQRAAEVGGVGGRRSWRTKK